MGSDQETIEEQSDVIYIMEMASALKRDEHTVRRWVRDSEIIFVEAGFIPNDRGYLPRELWPEREEEGRGRIYWNLDQVDGMKDFAKMKAARKGWAGSKRGDS